MLGEDGADRSDDVRQIGVRVGERATRLGLDSGLLRLCDLGHVCPCCNEGRRPFGARITHGLLDLPNPKQASAKARRATSANQNTGSANEDSCLMAGVLASSSDST